MIFLITMAIYSVLQIGEALANNITALLVIRFISGVFSAAPLTNAGGVIADTWYASLQCRPDDITLIVIRLGAIGQPLDEVQPCHSSLPPSFWVPFSGGLVILGR